MKEMYIVQAHGNYYVFDTQSIALNFFCESAQKWEDGCYKEFVKYHPSLADQFKKHFHPDNAKYWLEKDGYATYRGDGIMMEIRKAIYKGEENF